MTKRGKLLTLLRIAVGMYVLCYVAALIVIAAHGRQPFAANTLLYALVGALVIYAISAIIPVALLVLLRFRNSTFTSLAATWATLAAAMSVWMIASPI